jgi:hypothetical protein
LAAVISSTSGFSLIILFSICFCLCIILTICCFFIISNKLEKNKNKSLTFKNLEKELGEFPNFEFSKKDLKINFNEITIYKEIGNGASSICNFFFKFKFFFNLFQQYRVRYFKFFELIY